MILQLYKISMPVGFFALHFTLHFFLVDLIFLITFPVM